VNLIKYKRSKKKQMSDLSENINIVYQYLISRCSLINPCISVHYNFYEKDIRVTDFSEAINNITKEEIQTPIPSRGIIHYTIFELTLLHKELTHVALQLLTRFQDLNVDYTTHGLSPIILISQINTTIAHMLLQELIDCGANINILSIRGEYTPLICSVINRNETSIKILLENGADARKKGSIYESAFKLIKSIPQYHYLLATPSKGSSTKSAGIKSKT